MQNIFKIFVGYVDDIIIALGYVHREAPLTT